MKALLYFFNYQDLLETENFLYLIIGSEEIHKI